MSTGLKTLETMGEKIRNVEDRLIEQTDILAETKAKLVFDPSSYRRRSRRHFIARPQTIAAAVAFAAAAAVLLVLLLGQKNLTVLMDGRSLPSGAWISSLKSPARLAFSDGSIVRLRESSGLRVRELTPHGAHLLLENGSLEADVVHRDQTEWKVDAGPYRITVVGTRFEASWNPKTEEIHLKMNQGKVRVDGPMVASRVVGEGETLFASLSEGAVKIDFGTSQNRAVVAAVEPAEQPADSIAKSGGGAIDGSLEVKEKPSEDARAFAKRKSDPPSAKRTEWQTLAAKGQFSEAVDAAEEVGVERILRESSADDLLSLGDAARHAGRRSIANRAYKTARNRFPSSTYSSSAAFALGLMAFDQQKDFAAAARWFEASLGDRSRGALSREASGRLMEALNLSGNRPEAKRAAVRYLASYPNGPHAKLARSLTEPR